MYSAHDLHNSTAIDHPKNDPLHKQQPAPANSALVQHHLGLNNNPTTVHDVAYSSKTAKDFQTTRFGLIAGAGFGLTGLLIMCIATPFVLPAFRKHCLPYVPATDVQLANIKRAIERHRPKPGSIFLDIGSGDGRVCRSVAKMGLFKQVDGVELNLMLVLYSRLMSLKSKETWQIRYHHKNLWSFPLSRYNSLCIFGVESMMQPLEDYLASPANCCQQSRTIFACRFPFAGIKPIDEIGQGIDTVWVYKLANQTR